MNRNALEGKSTDLKKSFVNRSTADEALYDNKQTTSFMKNTLRRNAVKYIAAILLLCSLLPVAERSYGQTCQNTETYESFTSYGGSYTPANATYTDAGYTFSVTTSSGNPFYVDGGYQGSGYGWNGTAVDQIFIDNSSVTTPVNPAGFGLITASGVFSIKSLWLLPSDATVDAGITGSVTFTGKLNGVGVFTVTVNSATFPFNTTGIGGTDNGYTLFDFSTAAMGNNSNKVINELDITGSANYTYMELDDMVWVQGGAKPISTTTAATSVAGTTATLNGTINANDLSTTTGFIYSSTSPTLASGITTVAAIPGTVTGSVATTVSASLTGLTTNTVYYYEVTGLNCATAAALPGAIMSFTTSAASSPSNVIYISPGTNVTITGDVNVAVNIDSFIDDGSYTDNTGSFDVVNAINFSGNGTTHFDSLVFNATSGTSLVNQFLTAKTTIIDAGSNVNANDSLDIAAGGTLINNGKLTGNVQGLTTAASATTGGCPSFTSVLSLNISGTEMAYQWQSSADSTTWNNITGANSAAYTATVSATAYYRCNLTTSNTAFAEATPGVKLTYSVVGTSITLGTSPAIVEGTTTANLPYTATTGTPGTYTITYDAAATTAGLTGVTNASLTATPIVLTVPAVITPAVYNGSVTVTNSCGSSTPVAFTLSVTPNNVAPLFNNGAAQGLAVCENAAATSINSLLTTTDPDAGQTETYTVTAAPSHGTLFGLPATAASGSSSITPTGVSYTPNSGYSGTDAFTITVNDGNGGSAATIVTVTVSATPAIAAGSNVAICSGTSATLTATGGATYSWVPVAGLTATTGASILATPTVTTTYTVTGTSSAGCTASAVQTVTVNTTPVITVNPTDVVACSGTTATFSVAATGTSISYGVLINENGTFIGVPVSGPSFTFTTTAAQNGYVFYYVAYNGSCQDTSTAATLSVNATPVMTVTPGSQIICNASGTGAETFTSSVVGTTYAWANDNTSIGEGASGSGSSIASFTGTNIGSGPISGVFTVTPTANSCVGAISTFTITVNPTPTVTAVSDQTVCNNASTTAVTFSGSGTTYSWTNSNTAIGLATSGSGNIASFTATNSTSAAITSTVTVTPSANSCSGSSTSFVITVDPSPTVTAVSDQTVCNNTSTTAVTFSGSGTTYSWTNSNTAIGLAVSGTGDIAAFNATNSTSAAITSTITVTPSANSCNGTPTSFVITVNPTPVVTAGSAITVCYGATASLSASGATTYAWAPATNLSATTGGSVVVSPAVNGFNNITYTVTGTSNGCSATATQAATIHPSPVETAGEDDTTICQGATITLSFNGGGTPGLPSFGTTNSWTPTANVEDPSAVTTSASPAVTTVYTVVVTNTYNCSSFVTQSVTVIPTATVNTIANQIACNNTTVSAISFSGSEGAAFTWTNNNTGIGLAADGTGDISAFTATNTTSAAITATITVTPAANSCSGTPASFTITVNPTPTVTVVPDQTVCNSTSTNAVTFSGTGTSYSWTNSNTETGLGESGSGNITSFTATNTTSAAITSTITVTPSANSCNGTSTSFEITVNPTPDVTGYGNQAVCNNTATTEIDFGSSTTGATYSWTNSDNSIGLATSGTGNILSFTATNATSAINTATVTVTPAANSCAGTPQNFTITVNPTPDVTGYGNQTVCNNTASTEVDFGSSTTGTTYSWTNSDNTIGLATTGTGNILSFTATNATSAINTATITVTPSINSCAGIPQSFTITVNPTPDVTGYGNQAVCNNTATAEVDFGSSTTGTTYSWTNSDPTIGLAASGTGNILSFTATNATSAINTATITVTPTANSCAGTPQSFTITVNPTPDVTGYGNQAVCNNTASTEIDFGSSTTGTTYSWTNSDNSIGLATSGTGNILSFNATNATSAINTATITVTPSINSCAGVPQSFTITVNPTPDVTGYGNQAVCNNTATTEIDFGGSTTGTTYSWTNSDATIGLAASGTGNILPFTATNATSAINTATITVTPTANSCAGTPQSFTITVNPTPDVTGYGNQAVCNNTASTEIDFGSSTTGTTYSWTNSDNSIGLATSGTGNILSFTATNATSAINTATITVTPTANSCAGTPQNFTITVNPTPDVSGYGNQTVCNNTATTAISFGNSVAGTANNWTNSDPTIGLAASGTGNILSFTATNATSAINTATITVTPSANSCAGTPQSFTITVNPTPDVTGYGNQTVCNNTATAEIDFGSSTTGTTYSWTNSDNSIGLASSGTGNILSFTATNATSAVNTATITVTPTANSCAGTPQNFTITVNPTPDVTGYGNQTVCNNTASTEIDFGSSTTGTTYSWTNSDNTIGLATSGTGNILSFTATNATSAINTATITVTPSINSCAGVPQSFTITVNPTPDVIGYGNQAVCNNTATTEIDFSGSTTGTTYSWTNSDPTIGLAASGTGNILSFTATNATSAINTATITVTPTANSCAGIPQNFTITVNPTPDVTGYGNQTVCNNTATDEIDFGSSTTGTTYSWTNSDNSIGLATTGTGNILSFTATNATSAINTATITVTPAANSCAGDSQSFTITVNPTPDVTGYGNQTICNNTATAEIDFGSSTTGTTYSWTNSDATIGLAASGTGNILSFTATNATSAINTATITVTPSANSCAGTPQNFTITVNPTPDVTGYGNQTLCNNTATDEIDFGSSTTGTTYSWTNSDNSIGLATTGTGNISSFNAINATNAAVIATITVTPAANSCAGFPQSFTITVNPGPTVDFVASQTVCNGDTATSVNFTGYVPGTTYSWTNSDASIGLASSGTGNIAAFTVTNGTFAAVTSTITVTPSNSGCPGTPSSFTITVNPTPDVAATSGQTLCNNSATAAVSFTGDVAGTVYNWTNSDNSIGLASSGTGDIASFIATNAASTINTATITVTPAANGCTGDSQSFTITVNPTPDVTGYGNQAVCNNTATAEIDFGSSTTGTTYSWTNSDNSIGLASGGTGNILSFTATNATNAINTATITVTPTANSCAGAPQNFTITVNPTPIVDAVSSATICNNAPVSVSFGGPVAGTTYSWTNSDNSIGLASGGTGDISITGVNTGSVAVTATVTVTPSANGCTGNSQSFTITVNPTPDVSGFANQTVCNNTATADVAFGSIVAGTTYSWTNSDPAIGLAASGTGNITSFTATNATSAINTATVTVIPTANSCAGIPQSFTITVDPTPDVTGYGNQTVCNNTATTEIDFGGSTTGTTYSWTNSDPTIGLAASGSGNILSFTATNATSTINTATITVTPSANSCDGASQSFVITVDPTPVITPVNGQVNCNNTATEDISFTSSVTGTTYTWTGSNATIGLASTGFGNVIPSFTVTNTTTGIEIDTIVVTPSANSCAGVPDTFTLTVNPTPTLAAIIGQTVCNHTETDSIAFIGTVTGTTYSWTNDNSSIGLATTGTGNYIDSFVAINTGSVAATANITVIPSANGCTGTAQSFTITVNPTPNVITTGSQVACNGAATDPVLFSGAVTGTSYTWSGSNATIGLATTGSGSVIPTFTVTNATSGIETDTIVVTPSANGCAGSPDTITITVNPTPAVDTVVSQFVCNNAHDSVTFNGAVTGTAYTWSNNNTGIGLATSGTGNIGSFAALNAGINPETATVTVTPSANGCTGIARSFTITVNPTPNVTAVSGQTVCNGAAADSIGFSGSVTGTTYTWSNDNTAIGLASTGTGSISSFTVTNTTSGIETATITVTPAANSCAGPSESFTITVNPTPNVEAVASSTLCVGVSTSATFNGSVAGTTYTWTNSNTAIGLASTGTGNIGTFVTTNSTPDVATAIIDVMPSANGCTGTVGSFTIAVNPNPLLSVTTPDTICSGTAFTYTATSTSSPVTFTWSRGAVTGILPATASGDGNINETLTDTSAIAVTVAYQYTLTYGGCVANPQFINVVVNPGVVAPAITTAPGDALCSNIMYQNFGASVPPASGDQYVWSAENAVLWGTGNTQQYTLVNFTTPNSTAVITLTASNITTGCSGQATYSVAVSSNVAAYPTVIYSAAAGEFICLQNNEQAYQWGYDNKQTLDSTLLPGEINQDYVNGAPDTADYYYWVMVTDSGCTQKAYVNQPTGITNVNNAVTEVSIFPNPATEIVNVDIKTSISGKMEVEVMNILGQHLFTAPVVNNKAELNVSGLPGGTYMVNCYREGIKIYTAKIMKD